MSVEQSVSQAARESNRHKDVYAFTATPITALLLLVVLSLLPAFGSSQDSDAVTLFRKGLAYYIGKDVGQDYGKSLDYFRQASAKGSSVAKLYLGHLYESGLGVDQDPYTAFVWYKDAAEAGNALAQLILNRMFWDGRGTNKDENLSLSWLRISEKNPEWKKISKGTSGRNGIYESDYYQIIKWYHNRASSGEDPSAQKLVGCLFYYGLGVKKDQSIACSWYRKAAEKGHAAAQINLGVMYQKGLGGLAKDEHKALELYRKAAEAGSAIAQINLGYMYEKGLGGLAKDEHKAVELYRKAVGAGIALAQVQFGGYVSKRTWWLSERRA